MNERNGNKTRVLKHAPRITQHISSHNTATPSPWQSQCERKWKPEGGNSYANAFHNGDATIAQSRTQQRNERPHKSALLSGKSKGRAGAAKPRRYVDTRTRNVRQTAPTTRPPRISDSQFSFTASLKDTAFIAKANRTPTPAENSRSHKHSLPTILFLPRFSPNHVVPYQREYGT